MMSDIHCVSEPCSIITPRSEVKIIAPSIWVIDEGLLQTSRETTCLEEYVPVELTSKAHIPSLVKAYRGNCPNCPCDKAFVAAAIPSISPVPIVLMPETGKENGLLTSEV